MSTTEKTPVWPGWETARLIGRGSFGAVYEIRRSVFGETERCALKYISIPQDDSEIRDMKSEGMDAESITRSFEEQARDIVKEYRLMMQLNDCPNVVHCYDVESVQKDEGFGWDIYIRMELLTPLTVLLSRTKDWSEAETGRLARDIGTALRDCRRLNIVHRDVKPQNIFVSKDGRYKLGDFGIARISEMTGSATVRVGTYSTMAPEVFNGERYGAAADVYSLGMVLYWLLNERRGPFVSVNTAAEKNQALRRRMSGEALPAPVNGSAEFKGIVLKCCAFDPKERYRSAEEVLCDLENAELEYEEPTAYVGAIHESPADPGERRFAPVGVGVLDDPKTATNTNGLSRMPAPTAETALPAEDETEGVFGAASVGAAIRRSPVTSKAETPDNTVGAGLAPARERGERRFAPVGVGAPDDPKTTTDRNGLPRTPAPTAEDEEKTVVNLERRKAAHEEEAAKANKSKKKSVLLIRVALAVLMTLSLIILLSPQRSKSKTAREASVETPTLTEEPTLEPIDETALAYENALALLEAGQYEEAIAAFEALGDYEDSAERLLQARYGHADALATEGKTYEAARAFSEIRDYRDAWDRCFELWGQITERETVSAGWAHTVGLRADGTVVAVGNNGDGQCDVSGWTDIVAVSAGYDHTVGLRSDGTVVATGRNKYGQCEVGDWTDIVAVSAEWDNTVGLRSDGTVVAVGFNGDGQCKVSGWTDIVAVSAGYYHTVGLRADGTVLATGYNNDGQCNVGGWTDIVAVSAGYKHTVGLRSDGTVLAVGYNGYGQRDVGDWSNIAMPEKRARN